MESNLEFTSGTYNHVTFKDMKESYYQGEPIEFSFETTEPFKRHDNDFFGLYKVGWNSPDNFKAKVDVPEEKQMTYFIADDLDLEDTEHYQICYVPVSGRVCGISEPFQYHKQLGDSSFVLEDGEDDMVIVNSMDSLVERINQLEKQNKELKQRLQVSQILQMSQSLQMSNVRNKAAESESLLNAGHVINEKSVSDIKDTSVNTDELLTTVNEERDILRQELDQLQQLIAKQNADRAEQQNEFEQQINDLIKLKEDQDNNIKKLETENQLLQEQNDLLQKSVGKLDAQTSTAAAVSDEMTRDESQISADHMESTTDVAAGDIASVGTYPDIVVTQSSVDRSNFANIAIDVGARFFKHLSQTMSDFSGDSPMENIFSPVSESQMTKCPACNEKLAGLSAQQVTEHIEKHGGNVCPICFTQYDVNTPPEYFKQHVVMCCDQMSFYGKEASSGTSVEREQH